MNSSTPLFSIVIPAYNVATFIEFALNSVYQQTYGDYEIIVIDDGSTDGTAEVLRRQTDKRLRLITQQNRGVSYTRNRGIKEAKGKYVALLDGDDAWTHDHLELAARFFELHPEYVWYMSYAPQVREICERDLEIARNERDRYQGINWYLEGAHIPMCSSCVIARSVLGAGDFFPVGIKMYEDNVAFSRLAMKYPMIGFLKSPTAYYRRWGATATDSFRIANNGKSMAGFDALMQHQQMYTHAECPLAAKLFFEYFSLCNWWSRIRGMSLQPWIDEMRQRTPVTGKFLTVWLISFAWLSEIFFRAMGKAVRLKFNSVVRQMEREASRVRKELGPVNA